MTAERMSITRLRPHHIYCEQFMGVDFPERGEEFVQAEDRIKEIMKAGTDTVIEVTEGVDDLCKFCPLCEDDQCQSPQGNEDEVRKWDAKIVKGLGISYGERKTAQKFRILITQNAPLEFCKTRCPWRATCLVFEPS